MGLEVESIVKRGGCRIRFWGWVKFSKVLLFCYIGENIICKVRRKFKKLRSSCVKGGKD